MRTVQKNRISKYSKKMKTKPWGWIIFVGLITCVICFVVLGWLSSHDADNSVEETTPAKWIYKDNHATVSTIKMPKKTRVICVVACGNGKLEETLVMIKSAIVFARKPLKFIVITEYKLIPAFHEKLVEWQQISPKSFDFMVRPVAYPKYVNETEWRKIFKDCASLRLFLPDILTEIDSVLYVDTDTVFLARPERLLKYFDFFNDTQYAGLAPECEDVNTCWYPRFAKHPFVPPVGVNSGVMLMNLTRMRESKWTTYLVPIYNKFKTKITWGDQDIINIIFSFKPEGLFIFDCRFNYRPDHCMYMPVCKKAEEDGAYVLHGSRGVFQNKKQPPFYAVYEAMRQYHLTEDPYRLLYNIKKFVTSETESGCSKSWRVFINKPELNLGKTNNSRNYDDLDSVLEKVNLGM